METLREIRSSPKTLRTDRNPGFNLRKLCKYAFRTLLVLVSIAGWEVFKATPRVNAVAPSPPVVEASAARHSTLSVDIFQKYVSRSSQRMYPRLSREIVEAAVKYSEKYDLSPILVLAVVEAESEFYPFALSKKNAKGLMQINPEANQDVLLRRGIFKEPTDIFDPDRNIEAGCYLLRRFINQSPDLDTALDNYLGADSATYKGEIHRVMGKILLLGITEEINSTAQHKIQPVVKVEVPPRKQN